jgi:hypothetical protein
MSKVANEVAALLPLLDGFQLWTHVAELLALLCALDEK